MRFHPWAAELESARAEIAALKAETAARKMDISRAECRRDEVTAERDVAIAALKQISAARCEPGWIIACEALAKLKGGG